MHTLEVTIFGDAKARDGIERAYIQAAVAKWNDACKQKSHIPHFVVDWEHDRTPFKDDRDPAYRTTILITFSPDEEAPYEPQEGKAEVAKWLGADNSIKIFGKCGHRHMGMPCEEIRSTIVWKSPWGSMVIAHEIGHALGLDHDSSKCKMHGLMQAILNKEAILPILPEYCRLADDINNEESPCNKIVAKSTEHPCNNP